VRGEGEGGRRREGSGDGKGEGGRGVEGRRKREGRGRGESRAEKEGKEAGGTCSYGLPKTHDKKSLRQENWFVNASTPTVWMVPPSSKLHATMEHTNLSLQLSNGY